MPSNDFNGDPICILSEGDARDALKVFDAFGVFLQDSTVNDMPVYQKLVKFLNECGSGEDDNHKRIGEGVYQKRLWEE